MAVNRFWNQPLTAEYSPMSMQELSYAPEIMYKRDQDLIAKVDAMNEASASIKSVLGDKASTATEFEAGQKKLLDKISREGATKANLDLARSLKKTWINEMVPQEKFAKERQRYGEEYAKALSSDDNIVVGANPLTKTFAEYSSDPNSLNSFKTASRDKLVQTGRMYGANYAEGNTSRDLSDIDLGIMNFVKGFRNQDEAFRAYSSDPKFKSLINAQVDQIANSRGLDPSHKEVRDAITGGIMSGVVGGMERTAIPASVLKGMMTKENSSAPDYLSIEDSTVLNIVDEPTLDMAANDPAMRKELDKTFNSVSGGKFPSYESYKNRAQSKIEYPNLPGPLGAPQLVDEGSEYMLRAKDMLKQNPFFATTQMVDFNNTSLARLGSTDGRNVEWMQDKVINEDLNKRVITGELAPLAYTKEGKDLMEKIGKSEITLKSAKFSRFGAQGMSDTVRDPATNRIISRDVNGTGRPVLVFDVVYNDGSKSDKPASIAIDPTKTSLYSKALDRLTLLYDREDASDNDKLVIKNVTSLLNKWNNSLRSSQ
jgi:hypothetical protein